MPGQGIPCSFQEMLLHISGPSGINHLGITSFPSKQTRKLSREEPRKYLVQGLSIQKYIRNHHLVNLKESTEKILEPHLFLEINK